MSRFHDNRLRSLAEAVRGGTMRAASENMNTVKLAVGEALMHTSASVITRLGRQLPVGAVRLPQKIEATMPFLPAP